MNEGNTQLDHVFLFVKDRPLAEKMMAEAGLRVNYSRAHPGQGTTNVCACLDDMFIELLWLDGSPVSEATAGTGLAERGNGRGLPLGIAWRGECGLPTVPYAAPFLPAGATIPVAEASADPSVPFLFQTPGGRAPIDRKDGLPGMRQTPHLTTLQNCRIGLPDHYRTEELLQTFDKIDVFASENGMLEFVLLDPEGKAAKTVRWTF